MWKLPCIIREVCTKCQSVSQSLSLKVSWQDRERAKVRKFENTLMHMASLTGLHASCLGHSCNSHVMPFHG